MRKLQTNVAFSSWMVHLYSNLPLTAATYNDLFVKKTSMLNLLGNNQVNGGRVGSPGVLAPDKCTWINSRYPFYKIAAIRCTFFKVKNIVKDYYVYYTDYFDA